VFVVKAPVVSAGQKLETGAYGPVEIASSGEPFIGHVVDESLTDYTVLHSGTRYVMRLEKSLVLNRYVCHNESTQLRGRIPLLDRLRNRHYISPNPDCGPAIEQLIRLPGNEATGEEATGKGS